MKWMNAALVVSLGALVACSSGGSSGNGGGGGEGGDDWGGNGGNGGSKTTSTASGTGGMGGMGGGGGGGTGGAGGAGSACDDTGNCQGCQQCAQTSGGPCADEAAAFQMNPNWQTFYQCITPCTMLPAAEQQSCFQTCCMANQAECASYGAFVNCVVCDTCPNDCSQQAAMCQP